MAKLKLLASTVTYDAAGTGQYEELIPEAQLATEVGVVDRTVRDWRERGAGPDYVRIGRSVFYRRSAIAAWIEGRTVRHWPGGIDRTRPRADRIGHTSDIAA